MNKRRQEILKLITERDSVTVPELAERFSVSQVTIRSDLRALQEEGLISRNHGGAAALADELIASRLNVNRQIKQKIAEKAAAMIASGDTIMIESGSTNALFAECLGRQGKLVTIITNSIFIAQYVKNYPSLQVVLLGGDYQREAQVVVGPLTRRSLESFFVGRLFVGCDGYLPKIGFTCMNLHRSEVVQAMQSQADEVIVLSDASKFGRRGVAQQLKTEQVSKIITDDGLSEEICSFLKKHRVDVILVESRDQS